MRLSFLHRRNGAPPRRRAVLASALAIGIVAASLSATTLLTQSSPAVAAPGNPGTPSAPTTVYAEDFQNVPGTTPIQRLTDYTGATGQKYTANQNWLQGCNGWIASASQNVTGAAQIADCQRSAGDPGGQQFWNQSQQLAQAIGIGNGQSTAAARGNYADTAFTTTAPGPGLVEFQTASNIPFSASNRFIAFSVDVAAINCNVSAPQLQFQLLNDAGAATNVGSQVNGCDSGRSVSVPALGIAPAATVNVATARTNSSTLFSGSSIGVRMINNNGTNIGNDHTIDNVKILDVTPQMDKSFSPALNRTGGTSTLTFTVTNTSELGNKNGWSFNDNLPSGLTLANSTVGGTCDATTSAPAGGSTVRVTNGNLADGQASCTITVQVTSAAAGTYSNCPTTNVSTIGLNQPACANVTFADPKFTVAKTADKTSAKQGDTVKYTVAVKNTGDVPYTDANPAKFTDDLSKVLDDATYNGDASTGATVSGNTLSWSGALAVGETKNVTYSVTVNTPDAGDKILTNAITPDTTTGGSCETASSCRTNTPVQSYSIEKTVDATTVSPGKKITYQVTVKNTGQVDYTTANPVAFTDDLSKVTDDATYNNDATNGATVSGNTLSWSGPLSIGQTRTFTYSFTVNSPDTGDKELTNAVVPNDPTACAPGACTTTVPGGEFTTAKTASVESAKPGDTVTYTVTVKNTGKVAYTAANPAAFTDDLSKVTDDATYNDDASDGATVSGNTLSWSGPLAIGETKTITYSVKVNTPDTGDHRLKNAVTPSGPDGRCETSTSCATDTPVQSFTTKKTVDKTTVNEGDTVTYTVTVTNNGQVAYTSANPASFTDDLSKVTDDATYNDDATNGATVTGDTLSWSGPLAVGATTTVKYSFTVNTPDTGDKKLSNAVVPDPDNGGACETAGGCTTNTTVASFTTSKSTDKSSAKQGETVTYTVTVKNTGQSDYTENRPAGFTDDLSKVTDDATYNGDAKVSYSSSSTGKNPTVSGDTLTWAGPLQIGETATITYSVKVNTPDTGDHKLTNAVTPNDGGTCDPADSCTTNTPVQSYTIKKAVDATEVTPGKKVTYTVTIENTGQVDYTNTNPIAFTDDLSKVTDDATYNGDATNGASVSGDTLTWSGPLEIGATTTITYSFTVNTPDTGDKKLINAVVPNDPTACVGTCSTQVPSGSFLTAKSVDKSTAKQGDTVKYTVTVKNTGQVAYTDQTPASFTDDLSKVTDDATYNGDAKVSYSSSSTGKNPTVSGDTLTWAGPLQVGETATITYSVKVNTPDTGDKKLTNTVVPTGPGGACTPGKCVTSTPIGSFKVAKTVDKSTVGLGGVVHYTITVTNTGQFAYTTETPASFTDDLSKVTDDATYNGDATNGATVSGNTLSWKGQLGIGATKMVTYSFTVKNPDTGDRKIKNVVAPGDGGSCSTQGGCTTNTTVTPDPPTPVTPHGPTVATGGTAVDQAPLWPMLGGAGAALAALLTLLVMAIIGRRRNGDSV